ncbi:hypothetical protein [Lactobacillus brevis ATCC 367] [Lactiplantibacillus mudanjiangensis]|uniref:MucBP domain-containing protein n=1 Tax=Lactiplantibacillus mudanjiangensis TaxID=1296538 RepID=UPI001014FE74|nr:MucBP domain-containing protein [Lactiplantibacillus mudanjiangensis]VDG33130.1 hypothetical protein [Lactobacillus brevis ATCC 367] [Lactiplantibacillus mudanjiangensis]
MVKLRKSWGMLVGLMMVGFGLFMGPKQNVAQAAVHKGTITIVYKMNTGGVLDQDKVTGKIGKSYTAKGNVFDHNKNLLLQGSVKRKLVFKAKPQKVVFVYAVPYVNIKPTKIGTLYQTVYADKTLKSLQLSGKGAYRYDVSSTGDKGVMNVGEISFFDIAVQRPKYILFKKVGVTKKFTNRGKTYTARISRKKSHFKFIIKQPNVRTKTTDFNLKRYTVSAK